GLVAVNEVEAIVVLMRAAKRTGVEDEPRVVIGPAGACGVDAGPGHGVVGGDGIDSVFGGIGKFGNQLPFFAPPFPDPAFGGRAGVCAFATAAGDVAQVVAAEAVEVN